MKKIINPAIVFALFGAWVLLDSCSKQSDPDPIPLLAKAGEDKTADVMSTVTLDGSASTGPASFQYKWELTGVGGANLGPGQVAINTPNAAKATFVPPKNGIYNFKLTITSDNLFSTDEVTITVSTVTTLTGTLADNLALQDTESDPGKPDYRVTGDFIIPTGKTLSVSVSGVVIEMADNAGVEIQGTWSQTNAVKFSSTAGWKGIFLNGGSVTLVTGTTIDKAGKSAFTGQAEAAAVTLSGNGLASLNGVIFTGSAGYDVLIVSGSASAGISSCAFSSTKPIKAPMANLRNFGNNAYPTPYDYITLTTPGAGTTVANGVGDFTFQTAKYYIDGDFTAGSRISTTNATIYMKAGAGILASGGIIASGTTFDGLAGAAWKGITLAGSGSGNNSMTSSFVKNAGSAVFNTGAFTSPAKAAIYCFSGSTQISSTEISNSGGYGIYMDAIASGININGMTIKNTAQAGISGPINLIQAFGGNSANGFTMNAGVPAVEVQSIVGSAQAFSTWPSLGGTNYYLFMSGYLMGGGSWTLAPGVNVKFKSGKTLYIQQGLFKAIGTAQDPITFDSELGTPGTWPGILLESTYNLEYCNIKNGGQSEVFKLGTTPATEKANVVFNYGGASLNNTFRNNTISNGAGYGSLIESGKQDIQPLLAGNSNTYTSNALGTNIKKP